MAARNIERKNTNSRLLKNYGSWLYCTNCNNTVAYICYTTYQWIKISFQCSCGSTGEVELKEAGATIAEEMGTSNQLVIKKNRYCCPIDEEPLFSVVTKQVINFQYEVSCITCKLPYKGP